MASTTKTWVNNQAPSCEDDDLNGFKLENNNLILGSDQVLSTSDNEQTHKSVATYSAVGSFFTGAGIADAYTVSAPSPRVNPPARKNGMVIRFIPPADNTGACTLNAFSLGVDDIKLEDGLTDPASGSIKSGLQATVIDRLTYFELRLDYALGLNQTWQDVTGSRSLGPVFTNTTGRPIMVSVTTSNAVASSSFANQLKIDTVPISVFDDIAPSTIGFELFTLQAIVPADSTYEMTSLQATLSSWMELR